MHDNKINEYTIKYLDYIMNRINYSENSSFKIKGWFTTILSLMLTATKYFNYSNIRILILISPIYYLIILDVHYTNEKQKYKNLYEQIRQDFCKSNNTSQLFDLQFEIRHLSYRNFHDIGNYFINSINRFEIISFYGFISLFILFFIFPPTTILNFIIILSNNSLIFPPLVN